MSARLEDLFDAVVCLTQSDWKTEPRSNRYHYASRFAARLPTYFVQPDGPHMAITEEPSGTPGLTLVHCDWGDIPQVGLSERFHAAQGGPKTSPAEALAAFLGAKGVRRPLLWIYAFGYSEFILACPDAFKVFHATEDFTLQGEGVRIFDEDYRDRVYAGLRQCDLLVAVSDPVLQNYLARTPFEGRGLTLPNGCDFNFWFSSKAWDYRPKSPRRGLLTRLTSKPPAPRPVAFYQGGVNDRLDLPMLETLIQAMPDIDFAFCGRTGFAGRPEAEAVWNRMLAAPNVLYHGELEPDGVAELARSAAVGLIPYRDMPMIAISLPLKAYEYLACGLPVVSVPIPALKLGEGDFTFARTAGEYEAALRRVIPTRADPAAVEARLAAARAMDYDRRFEELEAVLAEQLAKPRTPKRRPVEVEARVFDPSAVSCRPEWTGGGAGLVQGPEGPRLSMPFDPWNPGAVLPLGLDPALWSAGPLTLVVRVSEVRGAVRVGLWDEDGGAIAFEETLVEQVTARDYRLLLRTPPAAFGLLLRSGEAGGGTLVLHDVRLVRTAYV